MTAAHPPPVRAIPFLGWRRRPWRLVERNALAYRRMWYIFLSGFAEPLFFLLSIGIGVGELVGDVQVGSQTIDYRTFVASGLLATAAMNGSLLDTTFNFFAKMKYAHTFDAVLATPLGPRDVARGELLWALLRGSIYSAAFVVTMWLFDDLLSLWAVLMLPTAVLIGFAFAGAGLAACTPDLGGPAAARAATTALSACGSSAASASTAAGCSTGSTRARSTAAVGTRLDGRSTPSNRQQQ